MIKEIIRSLLIQDNLSCGCFWLQSKTRYPVTLEKSWIEKWVIVRLRWIDSIGGWWAPSESDFSNRPRYRTPSISLVQPGTGGIQASVALDFDSRAPRAQLRKENNYWICCKKKSSLGLIYRYGSRRKGITLLPKEMTHRLSRAIIATPGHFIILCIKCGLIRDSISVIFSLFFKFRNKLVMT